MEQQQTLRILKALAQGVHPATGEQFGADSPYQHPDTVRALFAAIRAVEGVAAPAASAERQSGPALGNTGTRWTPEEEERLAAAFDTGRTVADLAQAHNRSRAAIEARLVRIGKLDATQVTTQLRYPPKAVAPIAREERAGYRAA